MPHLLSLSIRDRRTRSDKASASVSLSDTPANGSTTTANIKSFLFPRRAATMGNAPSSIDTSRKSESESRLSSSSKQMPGAEPRESVTERPLSDSPSAQPKALEGLQGEAPPPKQEERDLEAAIPPEGLAVDTPDLPQDTPMPNGVTPHGDSVLAKVPEEPEPERVPEPAPAPLELAEKIPSPFSDDHAAASAPTPGPSKPVAPVAWTPGTYVLLNSKSGTALDLHGGNHKSLIGYQMHGGANQQWEFIPNGHGYSIRSTVNVAHPLYLTVDDGLRDQASIVASPYPVSWSVQQTNDGIKISWPNADFVFDLTETGNVQLMRAKPSAPSQLWNYTRCAPAESDALDVKTARAVAPPATTETVTVTDGVEYTTTTRTTTTTIITTVTEVTRTPRGAAPTGRASGARW